MRGFWRTLDFHNRKAVVSSCGDNVESPDPSSSRFGLFAFTHLLFQDTEIVHLRQTAGIAEKPALLREALHSAPLCVLESSFPACSFPTDIQAHRHCDQVICSLNSHSFASLTVFWFLESPYFLSFREYPHFLAVIFLPGRWMCFQVWVWGSSVMRDGGEGYGAGVGTCTTEHQNGFLSSLSTSHWGYDTHQHLESIQWYVCSLQKSVRLWSSGGGFLSQFAQLNEYKWQ